MGSADRADRQGRASGRVRGCCVAVIMIVLATCAVGPFGCSRALVRIADRRSRSRPMQHAGRRGWRRARRGAPAGRAWPLRRGPVASAGRCGVERRRGPSRHVGPYRAAVAGALSQRWPGGARSPVAQRSWAAAHAGRARRADRGPRTATPGAPDRVHPPSRRRRRARARVDRAELRGRACGPTRARPRPRGARA